MRSIGMSAAACLRGDRLGECTELGVKGWPVFHVQQAPNRPSQTVQEDALVVCPVQGLVGVHRLEEAAIEQGHEGADLAHSLIGHHWPQVQPAEQADSQPRNLQHPAGWPA